MNLRASTVGELAARVLARGGRGTVTRVFPNATYVRSRNDFLVLLWGGLRSPLTLNIRGDGARPLLEPGGDCNLDRDKVSTGDLTVDVKGAELFRSSMRVRTAEGVPDARSLVRGVTILRSMYAVAPGPALPDDGALRSFVDSTLHPLARGDRSPVYVFDSYLELIGRGGGFTPAGDDFVGGFVSAFNFLAPRRHWRGIQLPRQRLLGLTVPESAVILANAAMGYVDEAMERLILASATRAPGGFHRELLSVARRGHTSGIDMALGVLLCEAAVAAQSEGGRPFEACLDALWNP